MIKTEKLNNLFGRWQAAKENIESFYKDGIIVESIYEREQKKLLFIAKEPNAKNHEKQSEKCFRKEWSETEPGYLFAKRIAQWANGILNNFPDYDLVTEDSKYLHHIAFMNLCKIGSTGITNEKKLLNSVRENISFLKEQIEIIEPGVIILCTGMDQNINNFLFPKVIWEKTGHGINVCKKGQAVIIDFYHPSTRNAAAASYALLKAVFNSKVYLDLFEQPSNSNQLSIGHSRYL